MNIALVISLAGVGASLHNAKPDYAAGMFLAIAIDAAVRSRCRRVRDSLLVGLVLGAAFFFKPVAWPLLVVVLAMISLMIAINSRFKVRRVCARLVPALACAAVVVVPLLILDGRHIVEYALRVVVGEERDVWAYRGSLIQHATYYLTGPGGRLMLGAHPLMLALAAASALALCRRRLWRNRRMIAWWSAFLLVCFLVPALSPVKIAQFAAAFSFLIALGLVNASRVLECQGGLRGRVVALLVLTLTVGLSVARGWSWPKVITPEAIADMSERRRVVESVYAAIPKRSATNSGTPVRVLICGGPSDLCPELFTLWSIRDRYQLSVHHEPTLPATRANLAMLFAVHDVIIVKSEDAGMSVAKRTQPGSDSAFANAALHDPRLKLRAAVPGLRTQGHIWILVPR